MWRPEHRLYPLLVPCLVILPAGLGIFGAALQYHLHYMVLAFAVCIINITETALVPVMNNYVCECFVGHAQEVTTVLNFYRLILGLTVTFYISQWTTAVGAGWAFGTSKLLHFSLVRRRFVDHFQWDSSPWLAFASLLSWLGKVELFEIGLQISSSSRKTETSCSRNHRGQYCMEVASLLTMHAVT